MDIPYRNDWEFLKGSNNFSRQVLFIWHQPYIATKDQGMLIFKFNRDDYPHLSA